VRADYEFENNVSIELEGEQALDIMNIKHRTEITDAFADDHVKKLQQNRIPKKYNV